MLGSQIARADEGGSQRDCSALLLSEDGEGCRFRLNEHPAETPLTLVPLELLSTMCTLHGSLVVTFNVKE